MQTALPRDVSITLAEDPIDTEAGVLVSSADGRIRVDNTLEGRMARLRLRIQQAILERLLPGGLETGALFGG
jgi:V/A-type H+-transporting ATPase subunit E